MQCSMIDSLWIKESKNRLFGLVSGREQNLGQKGKETKNHLRVTFYPFAGTPALGRSV